jgi:hypothetical protein
VVRRVLYGFGTKSTSLATRHHNKDSARSATSVNTSTTQIRTTASIKARTIATGFQGVRSGIETGPY